MCLPEALDPLGQQLANPGQAPRPSPLCIRALLGRWTLPLWSGVLSEVRAQAHHGVSEIAHVSALFCPGQVFVPALHLAIFRVQPAVDQP